MTASEASSARARGVRFQIRPSQMISAVNAANITIISRCVIEKEWKSDMHEPTREALPRG
jgi:hypothetical protein